MPSGSIKSSYFTANILPTWGIANDSKSYVPTVPIIMSFKVFFWWQNKFLSVYLPVVRRFQTGKIDVSWFLAGICFTWNLMEYKNDHGPDTPAICTF